MRDACAWLSRHCRGLALLLLALGAWPLTQLPQLRVDNSIDVWLNHSSREYRDFVAFQKEFGGDEWILIAFPVPKPEPAWLPSELNAIAAALRQLVEANQVLVARAPDDASVPDMLRQLMTSPDGRTGSILVRLAAIREEQGRRVLMERVAGVLAPHTDKMTFHVVGPPVVNAALDRESERQARRFIGAAFVVSTLALFAVFRSLFFVAVATTTAGAAVLWSLGLSVVCGLTLNMVTTVLPVLLWVLALSGAIHLIHHLRHAPPGDTDAESSIADALARIAGPYAIASLTTAVGFLALLTSHMQPVRQLGMHAALGIGVAFAANLVLIPALCRLFSRGWRHPQPASPIRLRIPPEVLHQQRHAILAGGVVLLLVSAALAPRVRVDSNIMNFFGPKSTLRRDTAFVQERLTGVGTIELAFRGALPACFQSVAALVARLDELPGAKAVFFPAAGAMRMTVFLREMESHKFNQLVSRVRNLVDQTHQPGVDAVLTGSVVLLNQVQTELVDTQLKSFGIALTLVVAVLLLLFRSLPVVLMGTVVNLLPVAVLAGSMGGLDIPLNTATVMIASIAIGIAVDDTVFFLVTLHSRRRRRSDWTRAIAETCGQVAAPITGTSLVIACGFGVLVLADFRPIFFFGLLGALTMLVAWIGDALLLPALLYTFNRFIGKGGTWDTTSTSSA